VDTLIGAALMIRREVIEGLSGFDERFFFFLEETDFCVRAKESGYKVIFFKDASIIHLQGKTVGKNWIKGRIEYNISLYKFIKKYHTSTYYNIFKTVRFLKSFIFLVLFSILFFVLLQKKMRKAYSYYFNLFLWHLGGCQDTAGLRANSLKQI